MSEPIVVVLPLPARALSPNARTHWAAKSKAVREARNGARWRALGALAALDHCPAPRWEAAEVELVFYHKQQRGRDADNALASAKAAIDGLADAGIVANDKAFRFLPVRFEIDKAEPRLEILVRAACR